MYLLLRKVASCDGPRLGYPVPSKTQTVAGSIPDKAEGLGFFTRKDCMADNLMGPEAYLYQHTHDWNTVSVPPEVEVLLSNYSTSLEFR